MTHSRIALLLSVVGFSLAMIGGAVALSSYVEAENERRLMAAAAQTELEVAKARERLIRLAKLVTTFDSEDGWVPLEELSASEKAQTHIAAYKLANSKWRITCVCTLTKVGKIESWSHRLDDRFLDLINQTSFTNKRRYTTWFEPETSGGVRLHVAFFGSQNSRGGTLHHASTPIHAPQGTGLLARCEVVNGWYVHEAFPVHEASNSMTGATGWPSREFLRPADLPGSDVIPESPGVGFMKQIDPSARLVIRIPPSGPPPGVVTIWTLAVSMSLIALALFVVRGRRSDADIEGPAATTTPR